MTTAQAIVRKPAAAAVGRFHQVSGGPARSRVVLILALVLALDSADLATIGAIAGKLEGALGITNFELGVIASVPSAMTALATLPAGWLTDRIRRVPILLVGTVVLAVGQGVSGFSEGFGMLLLIRIAVGFGTAPGGPTLASLVGDYFPARDRAHVWGLILTGELLGAGFGFLVAGELASLESWRWAFYVLSLPSIAVVYVIWRWLPEPARGGPSRLERGATEIVTADRVEGGDTGRESDEAADEHEESAAQRKVAEEHVPPREELVLHEDPQRMGLWRASLYTLKIPTNLILIIASALGYFYFTGVQTFGIVFIRARFSISQSAAVLYITAVGLSAIVGVLVGGFLADWLVRRGRVKGRITIGGVAFVGAALLFFPGLMLHPLGLAIASFVATGMFFGARNPPLDAARLDVMHHRLWGRAEGVRTVLRRVMVAAAPISFGVLADQLGSGRPLTGVHGFGAHASSTGMRLTFLLLLVTLFAGGLITLRARRTYPTDVSTALASEAATAGSP